VTGPGPQLGQHGEQCADKEAAKDHARHGAGLHKSDAIEEVSNLASILTLYDKYVIVNSTRDSAIDRLRFWGPGNFAANSHVILIIAST
jgi:hypothetical protein